MKHGWLLALCVSYGCRPPCPPPTVIIQQLPAPAPSTPAPTQPVADDSMLKPTPPAPRPMPADGAQVAIAARLVEEGRKLLAQKQYANATMKFREAVARVPEAKYFFHLCESLYQEGKFSEALVSCDAVRRSSPDSDLERKTRAQIQKIEAAARAQGIQLQSP
jgi:TolA-binding protein